MKNNLEIFEHDTFGKLEIVVLGNEPHFYGKDVALLLGYTNPNKALRDHVDEDDKVGTIRSTLGGNQEVKAINESGLYSLILKSKLPQAKVFKKWVTKEVLPSIRKHGGYTAGQEEMSAVLYSTNKLSIITL